VLGDYDGNLGRRRPYRPVKRRAPLPEDMPDETTAEFIRQEAAKYPNGTPEEIGYWIRESSGRVDITSKVMRAVMYFVE
jgi:hypothetical protein